MEPTTRMIAPFKNLKGPAFDRRYISGDDCRTQPKAIQVYTKEATDAQSADLKAYANQTLANAFRSTSMALRNLATAKPSSKKHGSGRGGAS